MVMTTTLINAKTDMSPTSASLMDHNGLCINCEGICYLIEIMKCKYRPPPVSASIFALLCARGQSVEIYVKYGDKRPKQFRSKGLPDRINGTGYIIHIFTDHTVLCVLYLYKTYSEFPFV